MNPFTDYLQRVVDVLELQAFKYEMMADLANKRYQLTNDVMLQEQAQICQKHAEQLTEHACYIKEVIDNPQLLVVQ